MRFAILVIGGVTAGAASMGAVGNVFSNAPMFQATRALGGGNVSNFNIGEINPLKAYEDVKRQITSGNSGVSIYAGSATPLATTPFSTTSLTFPKIGDWSVGNNIHFNSARSISTMRR